MNRLVSALVLARAPRALATGALSAPAATAASPAPSARPEAHGLMTPLSLAVTGRGVVHVSQNFAGLLTRIGPGGKRKVVARAGRGGEVGAVSVRRGVVTYAVSRGENEVGKVRQVRRNGTDRALADLGRHERRNNPDGDVTYGFTDLRRKCEAKLPKYVGPAHYDGVVETHPYATTSIGDTVYVADAGANAVLAINRARATASSRCPPTDVEVGPGGHLYVTSLPGGPEDGSVGRLGSVLRVDRASGDEERVVRGLLSATGLAVADDGDLYVAELFGGRIVRVPAGTSRPTTLRRVSLPGDLEIAGGRLWATTDVLVGTEPGQRPGGKVRSFPLP